MLVVLACQEAHSDAPDHEKPNCNAEVSYNTGE